MVLQRNSEVKFESLSKSDLVREIVVCDDCVPGDEEEEEQEEGGEEEIHVVVCGVVGSQVSSSN